MSPAIDCRDVLITGATGYIGRRLAERLAERGHRVRALVRPQSAGRVIAGVTPIEGNALNAESVAVALRPGDTLVHLVGTPHPGPSKANEFRSIDLVSITASVSAASRVGVSHLVYVSVAHPAPVMKTYIAVRKEGERLISQAGLTSTILRPWYVVGPGHWWPVILLPFYGTAHIIPSMRESARRLGLVTLRQMLNALVSATENPPLAGTTVVMDVRAIRAVRTNPLETSIS